MFGGSPLDIRPRLCHGAPMQTKHDFRTGDVIEHNGRYGIIEDRQGNDVTLLWSNGERQSGKHYKLWMLTKVLDVPGVPC